MVASRERQHGNRLSKVNKFGLRILPVAAIYGGNASGKTNLFRALAFCKFYITRGPTTDRRIPVDPFRLASGSRSAASSFKFELLINELVYEYRFSVTQHEVISEQLLEINSSSEKLLFKREAGKLELNPVLESDQFLHFAFHGTKANQLYLTNSVSQNVERFQHVYDWFEKSLHLVAPDTRFGPFEQFLDEKRQLYTTMSEILPQLDSGVSHLGGEDVPFETSAIPAEVKDHLRESVAEGSTVRVSNPITNERFLVSREAGDLTTKKLVAFHADFDGAPVRFDLRQESDGTQRIIDLLPGFVDLVSSKSGMTYVIDELDRSLHSLLSQRLLKSFLTTTNHASRNQLLFTTHDLMLMDQELFRRDEMWVTERNPKGESSLIALSDYKGIRYDKDIRKSYLQGRLGGIPRLLLTDLDGSPLVLSDNDNRD